ncbi:hypothetical protein ACH437_04635 [Streptomyces xinghaiensis]|uniref:hypothetical protein n=1 Tax=Streptomyces xinghaiensis TaxID=1038928 RepID=UPI00379175A3
MVDVKDVSVWAGEDGAGGGVTAELLATGEVGSTGQQVQGGGEARFLLGVPVEVGGQGGADVVSRNGQVDHLSK